MVSSAETLRDDREELRDVPDFPAAERQDRVLVLTGEVQLPARSVRVPGGTAGREVGPVETLQQGRLAASAGAADTEELARRNGEAHVAKCLDACAAANVHVEGL